MLGGIGAGALLLVSTGVVVWSLSAPDGPYISLPGCGTLVSEEILDTVPTQVKPRVSGEFLDAGDLHYLDEQDIEDTEILGYLECKAIDPDYRELLWVSVALFAAHDQDREAALELNETLVEEMEGHRQEWADGEMREAIPDLSGRGWRETSVGDGGMVGFYEDGTDYFVRDAYGVLNFVTDNLTVWSTYSLYGSYDETEVLDYMEALSEQLYEQITREAEPA